GLDIDDVARDEAIRQLKTRSPQVRTAAAAALTELALLRGGLVAVRDFPRLRPILGDPREERWTRLLLIADAVDVASDWRKELRGLLTEKNGLVVGFKIDRLSSSAERARVPGTDLRLLADVSVLGGQDTYALSALERAYQTSPHDAEIYFTRA